MPRLVMKMMRSRNAAMSSEGLFGNAVATRPAAVTIGYTFAIAAEEAGPQTNQGNKTAKFFNMMRN